eukprot:6104344-Pyramimonas_sp.AAC.1
MIVVLSVPCAGLAGWQTLNRITNPETWKQSRRTSMPLAKLAGRVAEFQLRHRRHFLSEHPQTTEMYYMAEWDYVRNHLELH